MAWDTALCLFLLRGVILLDTAGRIGFAVGIGGDQRVRSLVQDKQWLAEARQRRLQPLILDRVAHIVLAVPIEQGDLLMISDAPGNAVLEFIGSVDFAYDVIEHLLSDPFEAMTVVDAQQRTSPIFRRVTL